ncbi:MAG: site-specific integrase [Spirochaetaceae bacterium]|jgi:integrase|nr:site-specific integrase [Spirochaetaceae bacterium]
MHAHPFSVFKRAGRPFYVVSFKDEATGRYLPAVSTKKTTEAEAIKTAYEWLRDGIPHKGGRVGVDIKSAFATAMISKPDTLFICDELQKRGLLVSFVLAGSKKSVKFVDYLGEFWDYENSEYVKDKLRKKHSIHKRYVRGQAADAAKYWSPYFGDKYLGEITWDDIDSFINYLDELPLSAKRKNKIITVGSVPLKWAFNRKKIDTNVVDGHTKFSGDSAERQILTPDLAAAIFRVEWDDERSRVANLLAMVTGMRACEIQGLRVQDLGKECVYVKHAWNFADGLKCTKNTEQRTVEVPFPYIVQNLLNIAKSNPHGASIDSYVFWAEKMSTKPMEGDLFLRGLRDALVKIGMTESAAKDYTFHGWRHYYTSYMMDKVNEKLLQKQTGHKTLEMLQHYGGHLISGDREQVRNAQVAAFGGLLPEFVNSNGYIGKGV